MMEQKKYDLIIVGAGPGGYEGAIYAAKHGLKVAIIEKGTWGGVCLHHGCIPTKTLLKSSNIFDIINTARDEFGINITGDIKPDWNQFQNRKRKIIDGLNNAVNFLMKVNKIDQYNGIAKSVGQNIIVVNNVELRAKNIILAIGTSPKGLPIKGFKEAIQSGHLINSKQLLNIKKIPKSLTIIGGGVIGIEFAALLTQLGTKITIVEALDSILANLDHSIPKVVINLFKKYDVKIMTNIRINHLNKNVLDIVDRNGSNHKIESELVLQAVGRQANTDNFKSLNLKLDRRGFIITNDYYETSTPHIYAVGDINGKYLLAHVATAQCEAAIKHILKKNVKPLKLVNIPSVVYIMPEIGCVGKTETQLKAEKIQYLTHQIDFKTIGKAWVEADTIGFVRVYADPQFGQVYGAVIISETAGDMISYFAFMMQCEITMFDLESVVFPHPTLSEAIMKLAQGWVQKQKNK